MLFEQTDVQQNHDPLSNLHSSDHTGPVLFALCRFGLRLHSSDCAYHHTTIRGPELPRLCRLDSFCMCTQAYARCAHKHMPVVHTSISPLCTQAYARCAHKHMPVVKSTTALHCLVSAGLEFNLHSPDCAHNCRGLVLPRLCWDHSVQQARAIHLRLPGAQPPPLLPGSLSARRILQDTGVAGAAGIGDRRPQVQQI